MALKRDIKYLYKISKSYPSTDIFYMGGSPLNIIDDELSDTITGGGNFSGIAMNNWEMDKLGGAGDLIKGPAEVILEEGSNEGSDFAIYTDGTAPWDTAQSYGSGDILKPTTQTVGGVDYLVWTNNLSADDVCYAKVLSVVGGPDGTRITAMKIELGITYIAP